MSRFYFVTFASALLALAILIIYIVGMTLYYKVSRAPYNWTSLVLSGIDYYVSCVLVIAIGMGTAILVNIMQTNMPVPVLVGIAYPFWFAVVYTIRRLKRHDSNRNALKHTLVYLLILAILHLTSVYGDNDRSLDFVFGFNSVLLAGVNWGYPFFSWGQQPQDPLGARSS